jgi:anti-sigma regulatory factor (Ser/Thr protein kinase)
VAPASAPLRAPPSFDVVLPTDLGRIRAVRRWVEAWLVSAGWGEDDVADAGLVATELLQNAVEHGSRSDGREAVHVACVQHDPSTVELVVRDPGTGKGTSALLARDVTTPPPIDAARGRGLFLVHRMSETFDRGAARAGGSVVRVRFRAATPPSPPTSPDILGERPAEGG